MNEWTDIAVIAPVRDIDLSTVPALRAEVDGLIAGGTRRVIVNCQNVTFIDSTGLAFLLTRARTLLSRGGALSLIGASPQVVRFLQIARLIDILHVSTVERPAIPVIAPDVPPLWSKSFTIQRGVEHLAEYRHRVAELLGTLPLTREECFDVALAAGEALSNAYDHACGGEGGSMSVYAYPDRVIIEVRDCGCGYDCLLYTSPSPRD